MQMLKLGHLDYLRQPAQEPDQRFRDWDRLHSKTNANEKISTTLFFDLPDQPSNHQCPATWYLCHPREGFHKMWPHDK